MLKRTLACISGATLCVALLTTGCQHKAAVNSASSGASSPPAHTKPLPDRADASPAPTVSQTPLKDAVVALLEQDAATFPAGTKLKSVDLKDGVASLDFSGEFNGLANMGESAESQAQQKLQAAVAKIPNVEKMRVTVEGQPFESQATDWNTPFPVRKTGHPLAAPSSGRAKGGEQGDRP